jgi:hypothetical protein
MVESCAPGGDMPHTSAVVPGKSVINGRITVAGLRGRSSTSESIGWGGLSGLPTRNAYGERVYETEGERRNRLWKEANPPKQPDRIDHYVSAPAFAAWLSAQGQTPSIHVAAWFDAMWIDSDNRPIVPPESWAAQSPHGLQRCDGTADGRLVRLADVVAWLMQTRELPCLDAVETVCTALAQSPSAANALYLLSENGYANVLKATHSFFYLPIMVVDEDYPEGTAEDKGLAGALKYMRSFWGESSAPGAGNWCGQHVLDPLAVRLSLAHRLWGYGRRGDDVAQESATGPAKAAKVSKESAAERNRRRYQMCVDAGLNMPDNDYAALPDGIKDVAATEGISRQALSNSVKAHIATLKR